MKTTADVASIAINMAWTKRVIEEAHQSAEILGKLTKHTQTRLAKKLLFGAYCHQYAAMYFDFLRHAEASLGAAEIAMGDGTVKPTRQFLIDNVCLAQLSMIDDTDPEGFVAIVRKKLMALSAVAGGVR